MTVVGGEGRITITETQKKPGDVIVHVGQVAAGEIRVGSTVHLAIDSQFRVAVRANHSATHLLHAALRQRLGEHVTQKGSFVSADRFRFDISYPQAISKDDLVQIEQDVNAAIRANVDVTIRVTDPNQPYKAGPWLCLAKSMAILCAWCRWGRFLQSCAVEPM